VTYKHSRLKCHFHKSIYRKPGYHLCIMAIDEDEKEIPQEEELVEETEAVDEEEKDDVEQEQE
jgi:hypothetical protein